MLVPWAYEQARDTAQYHVQVELAGVPADVSTPGDVRVHARVLHVFRGRKGLRPGALVMFSISVNREGDAIPCGGAIWTHYEHLLKAKYMEVFLNGEPPECTVALWQSAIIDSASAKPAPVKWIVSEWELDRTQVPPMLVPRRPKMPERKWWQFWKARKRI
jgi:hypothetical protein